MSVKLYLDRKIGKFHDVDNRLKDILDALQGRAGGRKGRKSGLRDKIIKNDSVVKQVQILKTAPPKAGLGDGGRVTVRPFKISRKRKFVQPRNPATCMKSLNAHQDTHIDRMYGNTCRSPMAEGLARSTIGNKVDVVGAAMEVVDGIPATKHAITVAAERGADIKDHRSRDVGVCFKGSLRSCGLERPI